MAMYLSSDKMIAVLTSGISLFLVGFVTMHYG